MSGSDIAFTVIALAFLLCVQRGCSYDHDEKMKRIELNQEVGAQQWRKNDK